MILYIGICFLFLISGICCNVESLEKHVIEMKGVKDPTFLCSKNGHYPNPSDCTSYYSCVKGHAFKIQCPSNTYYSLTSQSCQLLYNCNSLSCSGFSGVKVAHPSNANYFGYCVDSKVFRVDKCPGQFHLDSTLQTCVPVCSTEGLQGDPFDCTSYYRCGYTVSSSIVLILEHAKCAKDQLYDALNARCTEKKKGLKCTSGLTYTGDNKFEDLS